MAYHFETNGTLKPLTAADLVAADSAGSIIVLDHGVTSDGRPYWAYIAVMPSKYKEFLHMARVRKPMRYTDYGTIIKHGFEKDVPARIRKEMQEMHGYKENCLEELSKEVQKAQHAFLKQQENKRINNIVMLLKNIKQA